MVTIDYQAYFSDGSDTSITQQVPIYNQDQILVVQFLTNSTTTFTVTYNGDPLTLQFNTGPSSNTGCQVWTMLNPPVGTSTLSITLSAAGTDCIILVLGGVAKSNPNFQFVSLNQTGTSPSTTIGNIPEGSLILENLNPQGSVGTITLDSRQYYALQDLTNFSWMFLRPFGTPNQRVGVNTTTSVAYTYTAIAFPPARALSVSFPSVTTRNYLDKFGPMNITGIDIGSLAPTLISSTYQATSFWQNSFLHTVGRSISPPTGPATGQQIQNTSQIIIDEISSSTIWTTNTTTLQHTVSSQDAVVVAFFTSSSGATQGVTFNGAPMPRVATVTEGTSGSSFTQEIYYLQNPPMGNYTVTGTGNASGGGAGLTVMTLLGVDKKNLNPLVFTSTSTTAPTNVVAPNSANSLILEAYCAVYTTSTVERPTSSQTLLVSETNATAASPPVTSTHNIAWTLGSASPQRLTWSSTGGTSFAWTAIAFTPSQSFSMWYPAVDLRNILDTNIHEADAGGGTPLVFTEGYHPSTFFQNSFLHTIGRMSSFNAPQLAPPKTPMGGGITIDYILNTAGATANTSPTFQIPVISQDSTLVVITNTGLSNTINSITYNGDAVNQIVNYAPGGSSNKGIYILNNPPMGVYPLTINLTSTGTNAVSILVLGGVSKVTQNYGDNLATAQVASGTNISTTINVPIPNSLILSMAGNASSTTSPYAEQTIFCNAPTNNTCLSWQYGTGQVVVGYNSPVAGLMTMVAIALPPARAASIWNPNVNFRNSLDLVGPGNVQGFDIAASGSTVSYGPFAENFYQQTFLATMGRHAVFSASTVLSHFLTLLGAGS